MNTDEALSFLRRHQPMPPDLDITEEEVDSYIEVLHYLEEHPTPESVPLLLNSLGNGCGLGMYQYVGRVLVKIAAENVVPHLERALCDEDPYRRLWSAQFAVNFPDSRLVEPLMHLLTDEDSAVFAAVALKRIGDSKSIPALEAAIRVVTDPNDRQILIEILGDIRATLNKSADEGL